ncbi:Uu.00g021240.m01.CDS01 [Anthostomella pinea]|uniref:Uu.00g021240.m01.CDS01 n=1 Tax=Anthostomella pinea TaxID=933095 RepID=A0AAI8W061_9PEZI|nr:Uu.00g021240.m01.CDS01 [Anthostomella pinea]
MESDEIAEQYYTHDGRLASFYSAQPVTRRISSTKGRGAPKALFSWPHRQLNPEHFARAGFFFAPTSEFRDNTVCFLCHKNVGGWEENDNPFEEHLRLSPHCGWAVVAGIEIGLGDYGMDDPTSSEMLDARKATFAERWPHEGKKGWKCKTKQLADAGWKYTPTIDSDDMATCTYCQLALDGWEPKDNPMDEHYRRSPDCPFFSLISQYKSEPAKKKGRAKGVRGSKASRLSSQSAATATSDMTSLLDHPANHEDSVLTTTSVMTQGGTKRGRAKKGTTAKGKKSRAKKDEAVEVLEDPPDEQDVVPPPPPKPTRGRKRASDSVEDSVLINAEAPAPKKRATRGRRSNTVDASVVEQHPDVSIADTEPAPVPKTRGKKGKSTNTRNTRKASVASTVSAASPRVEDGHMMDDEELDRQLQADMERPLSDTEDIAADSDSERKTVPAKAKGRKPTAKRSTSSQLEDQPNDHAMFDHVPPEIDEAAIDAELKALETEMEAEQGEALQIPKKGRKPGTRKASKQTTTKAKEKAPVEPTPEHEPQTVLEAEAVDELAEGHEVSIVSTSTVVRTSLSSTSGPKKRGRPSKKEAAARLALKEAEEAEEAEAAVLAEAEPEEESVSKTPPTPARLASSQKAAISPSTVESPPRNKSLPPPPPESDELQPPSTPKAFISPAPAAKQAAVSPSQSPQSSDAENQPPSSKPSNTASSNRTALAPIAATPVRTSPSKRNVFAGLQSSLAWTAVDLDLIFEDLDKENATGSSNYSKNGLDLTSPEKRMSVEEWIHYNAGQAEQKLKHECEAIVTAFEKEGTRAMQCLEGLVVE